MGPLVPDGQVMIGPGFAARAAVRGWTYLLIWVIALVATGLLAGILGGLMT